MSKDRLSVIKEIANYELWTMNYGTVIYKTSDNQEKNADGLIQKISDIKEIDIATINNAILNENK